MLCMHLKSFINIFRMVLELWPDTVYYMDLSQGQIIQKPNKQGLSSLFMTHRLNVMHAPVKFHKYIPYGLGVMARTQFTIRN